MKLKITPQKIVNLYKKHGYKPIHKEFCEKGSMCALSILAFDKKVFSTKDTMIRRENKIIKWLNSIESKDFHADSFMLGFDGHGKHGVINKKSYNLGIACFKAIDKAGLFD